jgi:Holliday junction resolvasome RuvABC endonuclease subunit
VIQNVIGLDLSLTETGISTPEGTFHLKTPASKIKGMERIHEIVRFVWGHVDRYQKLPPGPLVVIEGYSYGSRGRAIFDIGELGGIIRYSFWEQNVKYMDVPPSTLKIFAAGKGNVGKTEVIVAARDRLDLDTTNDNEADARWLREMGLHLLDTPTVKLPKTHLRALDKVGD